MSHCKDSNIKRNRICFLELKVARDHHTTGDVLRKIRINMTTYQYFIYFSVLRYNLPLIMNFCYQLLLKLSLAKRKSVRPSFLQNQFNCRLNSVIILKCQCVCYADAFMKNIIILLLLFKNIILRPNFFKENLKEK